MMKKNYPKIGIRPTIDGRQGDTESCERYGFLCHYFTGKVKLKQLPINLVVSEIMCNFAHEKTESGFNWNEEGYEENRDCHRIVRTVSGFMHQGRGEEQGV